MTVVEASKSIQRMITYQSDNLDLHQLRALFIALSVLDTLPALQEQAVNNIWSNNAIGFSLIIGDS
ncbi:hypothetical protein ES705_26090 [subsurface metagenome]